MTDSRTLTLIVPAGAEAAGEAAAKAEDFEEQAIKDWLPFLREQKDVDLTKLENGLERVQGQVDDLLGKVKDTNPQGFRLKSVEVSLAISAEGSIGVATAGVEASLALSFERSD